jgi:hypothetical protein
VGENVIVDPLDRIADLGVDLIRRKHQLADAAVCCRTSLMANLLVLCWMART